MGDNDIEVSVVIPVYLCEACLEQLCSKLADSLTTITDSYEIIFVNDASPDRSWEVVSALSASDRRIKGIDFVRNFGQHFAITAGLEYSRGKWVVVMDCDLQDNPMYIKDLYEKGLEGFDIVFTRKRSRQHPALKNLFARMFGFVFNWLSGQTEFYQADVGAYSLLSRKAVEGFLKVRDVHRHYLLVLKWLGFKHDFVVVDHDERYAGKSSYTLVKLIKHGIAGITSQSDKLLHLSITTGFVFFLASILAIIYLMIRYFVSGFLSGWPSLMTALLLSTGLILFSIGVVGLYIGKIFDQVKGRPLYLVNETVNF